MQFLKNVDGVVVNVFVPNAAHLFQALHLHCCGLDKLLACMLNAHFSFSKWSGLQRHSHWVIRMAHRQGH